MGLVGIRKKGKDGRREKSLMKCALHLSSVCQNLPLLWMWTARCLRGSVGLNLPEPLGSAIWGTNML